jgi:hypothetical protein
LLRRLETIFSVGLGLAVGNPGPTTAQPDDNFTLFTPEASKPVNIIGDFSFGTFT